MKYEGPYYRIDADVRAPVLGRLEVPILLAGFNKRMAAAGRVADGIIGHGLFTSSWWNDVVRPALSEGMQAAGRSAPVTEHGWVITAVNDEDPARAAADARRMIAFYLTVKTYDPFVAHHGWQDPVAAMPARRLPPGATGWRGTSASWHPRRSWSARGGGRPTRKPVSDWSALSDGGSKRGTGTGNAPDAAGGRTR